MNDKKVCCEKLQGLYSVKSEMGINLRIIQLSDEFIKESKRRGINQDKDLCFILTDGYNGRLSSESTKTIFIQYCPFCGKKLKNSFSKKHINETNHIW